MPYNGSTSPYDGSESPDSGSDSQDTGLGSADNGSAFAKYGVNIPYHGLGGSRPLKYGWLFTANGTVFVLISYVFIKSLPKYINTMRTTNYNFSQAVLLEYGSQTAEYLVEDLPAFTDFDPDLNEDKRRYLSNLIEEALLFGTDSTQSGILKGKTGALEAEIEKCHKLFESVKYFVNKKFGNNEAVLKHLRIKGFRKVRYVQSELVVFMYELAETIKIYRDDLISAGMKEADIDAIRPAAEELTNANIVQETGKGNRTLKTDQRIALLNTIYSVLMEFNHASKIVFANDPVRRQRYKLPSNGSPDGDGDNN